MFNGRPWVFLANKSLKFLYGVNPCCWWSIYIQYWHEPMIDERPVLPGCPSMLAKRMSELRLGYISIQDDMEWSCPWSWSSSRNFFVVRKMSCGIEMKKKKLKQVFFFQTVLIFPYLLTWKPSLFLRWRLLSLRSVFCFSSSSSFSRALMCSSKQMRASSLSISIITGPKKEDYKDTRKIFCACAETCKNTIVEVFHPS